MPSEVLRIHECVLFKNEEEEEAEEAVRRTPSRHVRVASDKPRC